MWGGSVAGGGDMQQELYKVFSTEAMVWVAILKHMFVGPAASGLHISALPCCPGGGGGGGQEMLLLELVGEAAGVPKCGPFLSNLCTRSGACAYYALMLLLLPMLAFAGCAGERCSSSQPLPFGCR